MSELHCTCEDCRNRPMANFGDIVVRFDTHVVGRHDQAVELNRHQYEIFELLFTERDRGVSISEIRLKLTDRAGGHTDITLQAHIHELRVKLWPLKLGIKKCGGGMFSLEDEEVSPQII